MAPLILYSKAKTKHEEPKPFPLQHRLYRGILNHLWDHSTFNIQTAALAAKAILKGTLDLRHAPIWQWKDILAFVRYTKVQWKIRRGKVTSRLTEAKWKAEQLVHSRFPQGFHSLFLLFCWKTVSAQNLRPLDTCPGFLDVLQISQGISSSEITAASATHIQTISQSISFWATVRNSICFIYVDFIWVLESLGSTVPYWTAEAKREAQNPERKGSRTAVVQSTVSQSSSEGSCTLILQSVPFSGVLLPVALAF